MPSFSLQETQEAILTYLDQQFVQPVVEMAVPDVNTVLRNDAGMIEPYVAVQFGDVFPQGKRNMATPMGDDYQLPIYIQYVAADPGIARRMYNKGLGLFLAQQFPYAGSVRKRVGGGMYELNASNGATEAYMFPGSFGLLVQLLATD